MGESEVMTTGSEPTDDLARYAALEICPCCGNDDRMKIMHWVEPSRSWHSFECLACMWATGRHSTIIQAIADWNFDDADESVPPLAADNARLRAALGEIVRIGREATASSCGRDFGRCEKIARAALESSETQTK